MAKIKTLRVHGTGEALYPRTSASAVTLADGTSLDTEVERLRGKQGALEDSDDIAVGADGTLELTERAKLRLFIDQWNSAAMVGGKTWGGYNVETGFFELNGVTDLTYAEALEIMQYAPLCRDGNNNKIGLLHHSPYNYIRAVWPINVFTDGDGMSLRVMASGCLNLETIVFHGCRATGIACTDFYAPFYNCQKLRVIDGAMDVSRISAAQLAGAFENCFCLEEVRLTKLMASVSFQWTPYLSLATLQYLVENAANTAAITVTVHADVFAKLADTGNTEWHALVAAAAAKNITFVKP